MTFDDVLAQVLALLQRQGRVSYGALKRRFGLDDAYLADLKTELIEAQRLAVDEEGRVLVWSGGTPPELPLAPPPPLQDAPSPRRHASPVPPPAVEAERRQLTVLFCDLVDSTVLAHQLDPEDLRAVIRAYHATCAAVIQRFDGQIAQYLGDGLLIYFGYPQAHEDDAQRAVHAGLGILQALETLNARLAQEQGVCLAVRLGIHTGMVVVGALGREGMRQERLALGDTPNIAARLQELAAPNTVLISAATFHLVEGYFTCQALGTPQLKGVAMPFLVYQVVQATSAQSRFDIVASRGLTPLVGREQEMEMLRARWVQARDALGQVVVLSGEAGIGKSRLVQELREHVAREGAILMTFRCSPYHTHSPLYPVIAHLHRVLQEARDAAPATPLATLERLLAAAGLPLPEAVPLFAALLSLPAPAHYAPLTLSPQRQKQQTLVALVAWLLTETERQPVLMVCEDMQWADPSSLELLTLTLDQTPLARLLLLMTCRPEFTPPWPLRAHMTPLTLSRLSRPQAEVLADRVAGGKALPPEVRQQIVTKTDGVPLFVEELTKTVLDSGLLQEQGEQYTLRGPLPPLAIPATLHDSLMARLDRLASVKAVAQLGAAIGRDFAYELLQAVAPRDEWTVQHGLRQLVEAELLYQRGVPPQATYHFKHALLQEAAYQSLLKSTRQQYHQRIAQVLEGQFPETVATQPELLAHHYTEAGLGALALEHWQRAGERALQRSANPEAVQHLTRGLQLLAALPETPGRDHQELALQMALGPALIATKGPASPEVERTYARARTLCTQVGETAQLFPTLRGLCWFYMNRGPLSTARDLGAQLFRLAQRDATPARLLVAHAVLGGTQFHLGAYAAARVHLEQGIPLIDSTQQQILALRYSLAPGVICLSYAAHTLWSLGYPDQALRRSQEALALAQTLSHPHSLAYTQQWAMQLHYLRREVPALQEQVDACLALATTQGLPLYLGYGTCWQGWALAMQGQGEAGMAQLRQGLQALLALRMALSQPLCLILLAEVAGTIGQEAEGLPLLAEALEAFQASGRSDLLAETYRLQGALLLHQPSPDTAQAEACFQQALAIARQQQAKSWELRVALSLSRLWQRQGKREAARQLLAAVYGWFTEGFDTADLQEARDLLEALG